MGINPVQVFTVASWSKHRVGQGETTSAEEEMDDACIHACMEILEFLRGLNPQLVFFFENPLHGAFRKLDYVRPFIERGDFCMLQYDDYSDRHLTLALTGSPKL